MFQSRGQRKKRMSSLPKVESQSRKSHQLGSFDVHHAVRPVGSGWTEKGVRSTESQVPRTAKRVPPDGAPSGHRGTATPKDEAAARATASEPGAAQTPTHGLGDRDSRVSSLTPSPSLNSGGRCAYRAPSKCRTRAGQVPSSPYDHSSLDALLSDDFNVG